MYDQYLHVHIYTYFFKCILDELSFDDFVDICKKEPVTTSDDLMKAFRKIDINGDGYISLEELHKILTSVR